MRKSRKKGIFSHIWELILVEILIMIYVFVHNIEGMKRREFSLLLQRENKLRGRIYFLSMRKEILLSLPALEKFARRKGLVPIRPETVQALIREGKSWKLKGEK